MDSCGLVQNIRNNSKCDNKLIFLWRNVKGDVWNVYLERVYKKATVEVLSGHLAGGTEGDN
jgi:hypothetical protein